MIFSFENFWGKWQSSYHAYFINSEFKILCLCILSNSKPKFNSEFYFLLICYCSSYSPQLSLSHQRNACKQKLVKWIGQLPHHHLLRKILEPNLFTLYWLHSALKKEHIFSYLVSAVFSFSSFLITWVLGEPREC